MRRHLRVLLLGLVGMGTAGPAEAARGEDVDSLAARVGDLENKVREMSVQARPSEAPPDAADRRVIDAQVLYELKNYDAAAIILLDVVEKYPNSPAYSEAVYFLADSLFKKRDFLSSRRYFEKILASGAGARHYQEAIERLIELSLYTGDYTPVDGYLQKLSEAPAVAGGSSVPYVKGKYFFFRQRYADAVAALQQIAKGQEYWFQAQYLVGACKVGLGKTEEAGALYSQLVLAEPKTDEDRKVIELADMALGRLYYERDQASNANTAYSAISERSELYPDALYEQAWVAIKDKEFKRGFRALDLLLTVKPDGPLIPEVRLLMGNLHIRESEWSDATAAFTRTRDEFEAVKRKMDEQLLGKTDTAAYFKGLIQKNLGKFNVSTFLPPEAARFVAKEPDFDRLTTLVADLAELQKSIAESDEILRRLDKAVGSPSRVSIFPELAAVRTRGADITTQLIEIENLLHQQERALVGSAADDSRFTQNNAERERLVRQLALVPRGPEAYEQRIKLARQDFDELDKRAVEVNIQLQNLVAERVAVEKYFHDTGQDRDPAVKETFAHQVAETRGAEDEFTRLVESLRREISDASESVGVDDGQMRAEESLKKQLDDNMAREQELLAPLKRSLPAAQQARFEQIDATLQRARTARQQVTTFDSSLEVAADERLKDIKVVMAQEKAHLAEYQIAVGGYQGETADVGGSITAASYKNIADRFYQIVVRSDVGIVDVAWALKQTKTDENSRIVREKKRELKLLDDEFKEVLKE